MTIRIALRTLVACLVTCVLIGGISSSAFAQDQGDKKQDEKKQDEKKKEEKKQDEEEEVNIPALMSAANQLRVAGEFEQAATIYKKVTDANENVGAAWHLHGYCLHAMGKLDEAIKLHEKATEFENVKGVSLYNLGCAYALKEQPEKALDYLKQSADAGFTSDQVMEDSDLESLHESEEFQKIAARLMGDDDDDDDDDGHGDDGHGDDGGR